MTNFNEVNSSSIKMTRIYILPISLLLFFAHTIHAQDPFIKLTEPLKENNQSGSSQKFIIGSTCANCKLTINDSVVKVYPTGAFAYEIKLTEGDNLFTIQSVSPNNKKRSKELHYNYTISPPEQAVTTPTIAYVKTYPEGDLILKPGDKISFRIKAMPGAQLSLEDGTKLCEMPDSVTNGIKGIYQGIYRIHELDSFTEKKLKVIMRLNDGTEVVKISNSAFSVLSGTISKIVITKGRLAHLLYGLGDDRLGGAKMGYIDSLIPLQVIGKVGTDYKIRLAPNKTAYIPEEHVEELADGSFEPGSLTGKIRVYGDSLFDFVQLQLFRRLAYQSIQRLDPSGIDIDVFGATSNTNWIDQLENVKEIEHVSYEQISDEIFRIHISLKHHQHWGHEIFYSGNNLVIKIKRQPRQLQLNKLTIAIDAGHGGTNTGAVGPTGVTEKELALKLALKLKEHLEKEGVKVIMTRETETFFDNKERILFYRDSTPDLLLSIHLNSANDPIRVSGTSTFYRYEGFRNLSHSIYKRMLELGLKEYGNNGSFNFMLNSPTEYPNALIETLFLSNPEEEMKMLDENFRHRMAEKIVLGLKDFLESCR